MIGVVGVEEAFVTEMHEAPARSYLEGVYDGDGAGVVHPRTALAWLERPALDLKTKDRHRAKQVSPAYSKVTLLASVPPSRKPLIVVSDSRNS